MSDPETVTYLNARAKDTANDMLSALSLFMLPARATYATSGVVVPMLEKADLILDITQVVVAADHDGVKGAVTQATPIIAAGKVGSALDDSSVGTFNSLFISETVKNASSEIMNYFLKDNDEK